MIQLQNTDDDDKSMERSITKCTDVCELIGMHVVVLDASNHSLINQSGKVIYESKHMITIVTKQGITKQIPKHKTRLQVLHMEEGKTLVEVGSIYGDDIMQRPFERVMI